VLERLFPVRNQLKELYSTMQKDTKFFSFLFSHKSKNRIYIRPVQISKKIVQNGLLSIAIILGISTLAFGISGVLNFSLPSVGEIAALIPDQKLTQTAAQVPVTSKNIDYSRPEAADDLSVNSGGPYSPEQLVGEDQEVEAQLKLIQTTSSASNLPSIWAHAGKINNEFGFRRNPFGGRTYEFHNGMDIDGERGDSIVAPAGGTVTKAGWQGGYGNMIEIDHGNGLFTRYGHMSKVEVAVGDGVSRGVLIGYVGSTGRSTGPHLHYELRLGERPINPRRFLPMEPTDLTRASR
jgi:murein DD-endopeptidase MepM/ murein hydrolase activator NlpD